MADQAPDLRVIPSSPEDQLALDNSRPPAMPNRVVSGQAAPTRRTPVAQPNNLHPEWQSQNLPTHFIHDIAPSPHVHQRSRSRSLSDRTPRSNGQTTRRASYSGADQPRDLQPTQRYSFPYHERPQQLTEQGRQQLRIQYKGKFWHRAWFNYDGCRKCKRLSWAHLISTVVVLGGCTASFTAKAIRPKWSPALLYSMGGMFALGAIYCLMIFLDYLLTCNRCRQASKEHRRQKQNGTATQSRSIGPPSQGVTGEDTQEQTPPIQDTFHQTSHTQQAIEEQSDGDEQFTVGRDDHSVESQTQPLLNKRTGSAVQLQSDPNIPDSERIASSAIIQDSTDREIQDQVHPAQRIVRLSIRNRVRSGVECIDELEPALDPQGGTEDQNSQNAAGSSPSRSASKRTSVTGSILSMLSIMFLFVGPVAANVTNSSSWSLSEFTINLDGNLAPFRRNSPRDVPKFEGRPNFQRVRSYLVSQGRATPYKDCTGYFNPLDPSKVLCYEVDDVCFCFNQNEWYQILELLEEPRCATGLLAAAPEYCKADQNVYHCNYLLHDLAFGALWEKYPLPENAEQLSKVVLDCLRVANKEERHSPISVEHNEL